MGDHAPAESREHPGTEVAPMLAAGNGRGPSLVSMPAWRARDDYRADLPKRPAGPLEGGSCAAMRENKNNMAHVPEFRPRIH